MFFTDSNWLECKVLEYLHWLILKLFVLVPYLLRCNAELYRPIEQL
jgi:hypothetical protein